MTIKIDKINIKNFKSFENIEINLDKASFIVFDGPNGFGKTTIYDAIELLFTGKIERYCRLYRHIVDKRNTFKEHPYLCQTSSTGDLEIICEAVINGNKIILKRFISREDLVGKYNIIDIPSHLYYIKELNSENYILVENEEVFLANLLSSDYLLNFEFINYVEQEENLNYLKQKDSNKKESISHLFNLDNIDNDRLKIQNLYDKIGKLITKPVKENLKKRKQEIQDLENSLIEETSNNNYKRLIKWKKCIWDLEIVDFNKYDTHELMGENSEFYKLKKFIHELDTYESLRVNQKIDHLISDKYSIEEFIMYYKHINNYDNLRQINDKLNDLKQYIKTSNGNILDFINSKNKDLTNTRLDVLDDKDFYEKYKCKINIFKNRISEMDKLNKSLLELKIARDNLINKKSKYKCFPEKDSICLYCGSDWDDENILLKSILNQSDALEKFIETNGEIFNYELESFKEEYIKKISNLFQEYIDKSEFDQSFFSKFQKFYLSDRKININKIYKDLVELKVKFKDLLSVDFELPKEDMTNELVERLNKNKVHTDKKEISRSNDEVFSKVFDNDYVLARSILKKDIMDKEKYLFMLIRVHSSLVLKSKKQKYLVDSKKYNDAKYLHDKLKLIKKIQDDVVKDYQNKIINDIEALFHIYSGRIVQNRKDGNGLFIMNDNGIRFIDNPKSKYDVLFKLSSGQLSSLIISFTLALNKKYSKVKLLLIDDPVQTLDDLKVASFIELLRSSFKDRQIIISTHEDMMSAYMRYKFTKYNIPTKRINLNEIQL